MSLNFTAAHSSRIRKRPAIKPALLNRSSTSSSPRKQKRLAPSRSKSLDETAIGEIEEEQKPFKNDNISTRLASASTAKTITEAISLGRSSMFDDLPENGGFNSVQIQDILNFRKRLPPVIAKSHLHALLPSPTTMERDLSKRCKDGTVHRLSVAARGNGTANIGEVLFLTRDIESLLVDSTEVASELRKRFVADLKRPGPGGTSSYTAYSVDELRSLMRSGFLISRSAVDSPFNSAMPSTHLVSGSATSIASISRAPSGSVAAVGGADAISLAGGGGAIPQSRTSNYHDRRLSIADLQVWIPGVGAFLKLAVAGRSHLLALLHKCPGRQSPLYLLKEKWDGAVLGDDPASRAKKYRREFAGVLPAKTRKWKSFYGMSFDWVLADCLGAGFVELFETGSVGSAARIV